MRRPSAPRSSARRSISSLASCCALVAALGACGKPQFADVKPLDRKVLFVGIDGLDYEIMKPVLKRGMLPKLAELQRRGIVVPIYGEHVSRDPRSGGLDPAVSWTTIATGFPAARATDEGTVHGVRDVVVPRKGRYDELPATSQHRLLPTFWDVLGAAGVKCAIVGWWTTWPAEPVNGTLVSDRFFLEKFGLGPFGPPGRVDLPAVAEEYRRGAQHLTWPDELAEPLAQELRPRIETPSEPILEALGQFEKIALNNKKDGAGTAAQLRELIQAVRTDCAVKDTLVGLLAKDPSIRFASCYLDSLDVATHYFWKNIDAQPWIQSSEPSIRAKLTSDYKAYAAVMPLMAAAIDSLVAQLCAAIGPDAIVILANDHTLQPDDDPANRDFRLDPLLEELGLLVRGADGAVDWPRTTCFDRTLWPGAYVRNLALNVEEDWPQGSVKAKTPQERTIRWQEAQRKLRGVKVDPPWSMVQGGPKSDDLFFDCQNVGVDTQVTVVPTLPGHTKVKLPARVLTIDQLFPPRPTSGRHADPGMLLLAYPGAIGELQGKRGIPMGKGGALNRHIAPLVLALFGIPGSLRPDETGSNPDMLFWMLELGEAQRMTLQPRVESYDALVRFSDPSSPLGRRRIELTSYVEGLGYDLARYRSLAGRDQAATAVPGAPGLGPTGSGDLPDGPVPEDGDR